MTVGRLTGDCDRRAVGPSALLRGGAALAAIALGALLLVGEPVAALAGLVLVGLGVANGVPLLFSAAGRAARDAPARRSPRSARWARSASSSGRRSSASSPTRRPAAALATIVRRRPRPSSSLGGRRTAGARRPHARRVGAADERRLPLCDLDGVLVDSGDSVERDLARLGRRAGPRPRPVERASHGVPTREVIAASRRTGPRRARPPRVEALHAATAAIALPGAAELLATARPPRSPSSPRRSARSPPGSRAAGLPQPAVLVTADDVRRGKPAPDPYLVGRRTRSASTADCLVFEDAPAGVQAGRAAGTTVWAVTTTTFRRPELDGAARVGADLAEPPSRCRRACGGPR